MAGHCLSCESRPGLTIGRQGPDGAAQHHGAAPDGRRYEWAADERRTSRSGQYARLAETHRAWTAACPDSAGVRRWGEDHTFGRPDQINSVRRRSVLEHAGDGYPTLPVSINGIEDDFILDTGA